MELTIFVIKHQ